MSHLPVMENHIIEVSLMEQLASENFRYPIPPSPLKEGHLYGNKGGQKFSKLYRSPYIETPFIEAALH